MKKYLIQILDDDDSIKYAQSDVDIKELWKQIKESGVKTLQYIDEPTSKQKYNNFVKLFVYDTYITIYGYDMDASGKYVLQFFDKYILEHTKVGNCIDDFIERGVESRMYVINNYINNIKDRVSERQQTNTYHNTGCYEKDFSQIMQIKAEAQKIVDNCTIQLQKLSEKYTKL